MLARSGRSQGLLPYTHRALAPLAPPANPPWSLRPTLARRSSYRQIFRRRLSPRDQFFFANLTEAPITGPLGNTVIQPPIPDTPFRRRDTVG
jgi:hypothetical protein